MFPSSTLNACVCLRKASNHRRGVLHGKYKETREINKDSNDGASHYINDGPASPETTKKSACCIVDGRIFFASDFDSLFFSLVLCVSQREFAMQSVRCCQVYLYRNLSGMEICITFPPRLSAAIQRWRVSKRDLLIKCAAVSHVGERVEERECSRQVSKGGKITFAASRSMQT